MRGGADDLHAALMGAVVRPCALKGGQEGMVDVWKGERGARRKEQGVTERCVARVEGRLHGRAAPKAGGQEGVGDVCGRGRGTAQPDGWQRQRCWPGGSRCERLRRAPLCPCTPVR